MKIDLLDTHKLSKIKDPTKLRNCLSLSLKDSEQVIKVLRKISNFQENGAFFCFLRCVKGFGMDILVNPELLEVEFKSIGCDFCGNCSDRYSFCNNFYIFTDYVLYKNQRKTEKIFDKLLKGGNYGTKKGTKNGTKNGSGEKTLPSVGN